MQASECTQDVNKISTFSHKLDAEAMANVGATSVVTANVC